MNEGYSNSSEPALDSQRSSSTTAQSNAPPDTADDRAMEDEAIGSDVGEEWYLHHSEVNGKVELEHQKGAGQRWMGPFKVLRISDLDAKEEALAEFKASYNDWVDDRSLRHDFACKAAFLKLLDKTLFESQKANAMWCNAFNLLFSSGDDMYHPRNNPCPMIMAHDKIDAEKLLPKNDRNHSDRVTVTERNPRISSQDYQKYFDAVHSEKDFTGTNVHFARAIGHLIHEMMDELSDHRRVNMENLVGTLQVNAMGDSRKHMVGNVFSGAGESITGFANHRTLFAL